MRVGILTGGGRLPGLERGDPGGRDRRPRPPRLRDGRLPRRVARACSRTGPTPLDPVAVVRAAGPGRHRARHLADQPVRRGAGARAGHRATWPSGASTPWWRSAATTPSGWPASSGRLGRLGGRGAQDDRQRPVGDRGHLRLPHRRADRHRGHRPARHDRRVAPPGHGVRGHGPPRRVDRRPRPASPAARPRSSSPRCPSTSTRCAPSSPPATSAASSSRSSWWPRAHCRPTRRWPSRPPGPAPAPDRTRSATSGWAGSATGWPASSSGGPASRPARPRSGTSSGAARRPRSTGCSPPASGWRPSRRSTTGTSATMVALQAGSIVRVPLTRRGREPEDGRPGAARGGGAVPRVSGSAP